jgi:type IV pilus modification protein PilV
MMRLRATGKEGADQGEQGFTLIEVMFAAVYLAVGLLGIAAMQDTAIARNTDARRMNYATNLTAEMLERIRYNSPANTTPILGGGFVYSGIQACSDLASCAGGETPGNAIVANNVTASGDYDQWRARLKATDAAGTLLLPNAVGQVTSVLVPNGPPTMQQVQITVTIQYTSGLRNVTATMMTIVAPL